MFATPQVTLINTSFFPLNSDHKECISEMYCFFCLALAPPPLVMQQTNLKVLPLHAAWRTQ